MIIRIYIPDLYNYKMENLLYLFNFFKIVGQAMTRTYFASRIRSSIKVEVFWEGHKYLA